MRIILKYWLVIWLVFIVALVGVRLAQAGTLSATVTHITDGDTIRVSVVAQQNVRVRLADIDAPELHGKCIAEIALAERARDRLRALVDGKRVLLVLDPREHDRYGRMLAVVVLDGVSVGKTLVLEGLARPWDGRRHPWC